MDAFVTLLILLGLLFLSSDLSKQTRIVESIIQRLDKLDNMDNKANNTHIDTNNTNNLRKR